jgi:hypothetical protein
MACVNAGGQKTSQVWRETANEDVCLAVACACRRAGALLFDFRRKAAYLPEREVGDAEPFGFQV